MSHVDMEKARPVAFGRKSVGTYGECVIDGTRRKPKQQLGFRQNRSEQIGDLRSKTGLLRRKNMKKPVLASLE